MTNYLAENGSVLNSLGYSVVRIAPGKKYPEYSHWQKHGLNDAEVSDSTYAHYGVGILCGREDAPVYAVDVDILDEDFSRYMHLVLKGVVSSTPIRVGHAPKFLIPCRTEVPYSKQATPVYVRDGKKAQIEFLGKGNQFVAFATHPETKEPYKWYGATGPIESAYDGGFPSFDELPLLTDEDIRKICEAFEKYAEEHGWERATQGRVTPSHAAESSLAKALTPTLPPLPDVTVEVMRDVLNMLIAYKGLDLGKGTHDEWIRLGMAIHHQTGGSQEGLRLWDEISAKFPEAYERFACEARWRTFNSQTGGGVTFRTYAKRLREVEGVPCVDIHELGLLRRVKKQLRGRALFMAQYNSWWFFDESKCAWDRISGNAGVTEVIRETINLSLAEEAEAQSDPEEYKRLMKLRTKCLYTMFTLENRMLSALQKSMDMQGVAEEFDCLAHMVGTPTGVLDLRQGLMLPNKASMRMLRKVSVGYDPDARAPHWEQAMLDWLDGDVEKVRYVQRLLGQAISGDPKEDVFFMLRGMGCNGKSVFMNTLAALFDGYAECIDESTLVGGIGREHGGRARSDLVRLRGARFVYCSETSAGMCLREAEVKRMTGRDTIVARAPYGREDIMIKPMWLLCVGTNYVPEIKGDDDGIWRRVADVEFPRNFQKDPRAKLDTDLTGKLLAELPGILAWVVEGYNAWVEQGLNMPESVRLSTEEYREEMDEVRAWFNQRVAIDPEAEGKKGTPVQLFYSDFLLWLKSMGSDTTISQNVFTRRLKKIINGLIDVTLYRSNKWRAVKGLRIINGQDDFENLDDEG